MVPFESFSYPFFDFNFAADHPGVVSAFLAKQPEPGARGGRKALYVHIPFCDTICDFCPFVKAVGNPKRITAYLTALAAELRIVGAAHRIRGWVLDSVYIGGGTPSVLTEEQLAELFAVIRENFTIAPDAEISFEFEAKSVTETKFQTLAELGVTRVSFGVQSFDPAIRDMVRITATLDQVYEAVANSTKYFRNTNLDMMVGFPGQNFDDAVADAVTAATSGIGSVSIYPVDYVMTLPAWQDRIRSGDLPRPAPLADRSAMFHAARAALKGNMSEQNMYCFGRHDAPPTRYMFSTLYGGYEDECVGVGSGAYSFIRGLAYYNEANEREYVKTLGEGRQPVACSSPGHAYEKGLVFFPKRLEFDMRSLTDLSLESTYQGKIDRIIEDGLARIDGDTLRLTEAGEPVYSELMVYFFSDPQRRIYDRMCERMSSQVGVIDEADWTAGEERVRAMGARTAMGTATSRRQRQAVRS